MEPPTQHEIEKAYEAIEAAGPMARETMMLSTLAIMNPRLSAVVDRIAETVTALEPGLRDLLDGVISGALVSGLHYGLRIADARVAALSAQPPAAPAELSELSLWPWLGEDELGSGEIGIKQAKVPAGMIPMVGLDREKMEKYWHHAEAQAKRYGKKIYLCRFAYAETVRETEHGE